MMDFDGKDCLQILIVLTPSSDVVVRFQALYNSIIKAKKSKNNHSLPLFFPSWLLLKMTNLLQRHGYFSNSLLYLNSSSKLHIWLLFICFGGEIRKVKDGGLLWLS